MKEHKFRAWDKTANKFWDADLFIDSDGTVYQWESDEAERWLEPTDNFIIVWFTGRKDKNDNDMCEEDIVRINLDGRNYTSIIT